MAEVSFLAWKAKWFSLEYAEPWKGYRLEGPRLTLPYVVFPLASEPLAGKWPHPRKVMALDPNHKNLADGVGTAGPAIEIENMPGWPKAERRIDALKAGRPRCKRQSVKVPRPDGSFYYRPSRRWEFFNALLDKAYQKRRDQTKMYYRFILANKLCRKYDGIGVGDDAPQGSGLTPGRRRAMNNQSLIGRFKEVTLRSHLSGAASLSSPALAASRVCVA